jgi:integrase
MISMAREKNLNHPPKGSSIKVEPIKDKKDITAMKKLLATSPRNLALFTLGINTALRASDLLAINYGQVKNLKAGEFFHIREKKTGKKRTVTINKASFRALSAYLAVRKKTADDAPLFLSREGKNRAISSISLHGLVKSWCSTLRIRGNYGSHTLRKTFGYHQRTTYGSDIAILMEAFNHSSPKQTLDYLCIQKKEVFDVFMNEI